MQSNMLYQILRKRIDSSGLMKKRLVMYSINASLIFLMLASITTIIMIFNHIGVLITGSLLFGFLSVHAGFIGHDAAHMSISKNKKVAYIFGEMGMSLIQGVSFRFWRTRHNIHHSNPNHENVDPEHVSFFAFSESEAKEKKGLVKLTTKYQDYLLFVLAMFSTITLRVSSMTFLLKKGGKNLLDLIPITLHFVTFLVLPMVLIGWWQGMLFYLLWSMTSGLYFGLVFIPNHMGMETTENGMSFMEKQLVSSRNIRTPKLINFLFGGLNYQIEHHLFPTMPRWNLRKASGIVKDFCKENSLFYHEEGTLSTYASIAKFSKKVAKSIRK